MLELQNKNLLKMIRKQSLSYEIPKSKPDGMPCSIITSLLIIL